MTESTLEEMRADIADEGAKAVSAIRDRLARLKANEIEINFNQPRDLPPEIAAVVNEQIDNEARGNPALDPNISFVSEPNQHRLDQIFEALLDMPPSTYREDLLFLYHLVNRAQLENLKLKRLVKQHKIYAIKTKLLDQRISLR